MKEWKKYKIKDVCQIIGGYAFKSKDFKPKEDIPIIKIKSLKDKKIIIFRDHFVNKKFLELNNKYQIHYNDYVIALTGSHITLPSSAVGRVARSKHKRVLLLNQRLAKFIVDDKICSHDFLYYFLTTDYFFHNIGLKAKGAANQANISTGDVGSIEIKLPPLPIQKKITKILSNYDNLIENNHKRINLLEESARITYEEWFYRFKINDKKLDIDQLTNLPFGWEKKSITKLNSFKHDRSKIKKFDGEKIYYATADIDATSISGTGEIVNWTNKPSRAQIEPNNNTVWFARMSKTYKILCFNNKNICLQKKIILSSGFLGFKATNSMSLPFLYFTINNKFFHEVKDLYATGATQVSLTNDSLKFIKIIEPSLELVEKYGVKILPLIQQISILKNKNKKLNEVKDILLPRLMAGTINADKVDIAV